MVEINIYSRYYNELMGFKSMLSNYLDKLFESGVLVDNYINLIEPKKNSSTIFNHIEKSLNDNCYSNNEKIMFIDNLLPTVENFGNVKLKTIEARVELIIKLGIENQHTELIKEYNKTKTAVKDIQALLSNKLMAKLEYLENPKKSKANNLSLREIALKYYYEGLVITKGNADGIANEYGWKSGHRLYQYSNEYWKSSDRRGEPNPFTIKKLQNKIKLFEKVIKTLPEDKKYKAIDEVQHLKNILDREQQ